MSSRSAFGRSVFVFGPEQLLAERAVNEVIDAARTADPTTTVRRLVGSEFDRGALAEATGGSLFASSSVVVIEQAGDVAAELHGDLVALAADPYPELAFVIVHPGGSKAKSLVDRLRPAASVVVECVSIKPWELPQFVTADARGRGGSIEPPAATLLVDAVGSDLRALSAAIGQLLADAGSTVITEAVVRRYFAGRAEVSSFAVADEVMQGTVGGALGKLRWALATGVAPVLITSALAGSLRSLGKYLDAREGRMRDADLSRIVGVPPWKLKDLARQSRDWTPGGVAQALRAVAVADADVKGGSSDAGFALEQVVLTVSGQRGRRRG